MRTLKFRIWHTTYKEMFYPAGPTKNREYEERVYLQLDGVLMGDFRRTGLVNCSDDYVIQQFTGLKDSKGVDIYEGDLLEFAYRDEGKQFVGEVQYFEKFGSFGVVIDKAFETFQDLIEYVQFFNVVGNIFETKLDVPQETL